MASAIGFIKRLYKATYPPHAVKEDEVIKFGILGAALIAPVALINPAVSHSEVVVHAVAARDKTKAEAYAKKYGIPKAFGGPNGYQELLDDPEIDAIYNPLPNGLHYEWTLKALVAGKHVLLEKPSTDTAEETQKLFDFAERKGLVLLEAVHYRFHPAIHRAKSILDSGELGTIKNISATMTIPQGIVNKRDIRFDYALGGGAMMDMGSYIVSCLRYFSSSNPTCVVEAAATLSPWSDQCDRAMTATLAFPNSVTGSLRTDISLPYTIIPSIPEIRAVVNCEQGSLEIFNFIVPTIYHYILVSKIDGGKKTTTQYKVYKPEDATVKGEEWWTTYRYQLEAFIDKVKGRTPQTWVSAEDSITNIKWVEEVYAKSGLRSRPKSSFVLETE